jgi:hypothetical protein
LFAFATAPPVSAWSADRNRADVDTAKVTASIADLIADLDSDRFTARKKATRALIDSGGKAVVPLTAAAEVGSLEVRIRVIRILQELYTGTQKDTTIDAAELALEKLAESDSRPLSARADRVLNTNYERREERAIAQIERLGGVINYQGPNDLRFNPNFNDPNKKQISHVVLGSAWKGGDGGLKYIRRLSRLEVLYLSGKGETGPISKEAAQSLQASLPNLKIEPRGEAYLGIGGGLHPRGCQVMQVKLGAAAAKAGFRELDVITGFGGKKIPDFNALITHIKNYSPGDKVKFEVLRGTETITLDVVMGEWKQDEVPRK